MKYDIKEILDNIKYAVDEDDWFEIEGHFLKPLLDYITNLQEKSNNQAEEINRLVKQREKFMKKYGYLKEENEKLQKRNKEIYDGFIATQEELSDYATRNEKAIEYIIENNEDFKTEIYDCNTGDYLGTVLSIQAKSLLNILNGGDEE